MALALMMARVVMALRKIALITNYFGHGLDNGLGFDDGQDGYGPEEDCLDGERLWQWP